MLSHGFLKNKVPKDLINKFNKICTNFINNKVIESNYFNLNEEIIFQDLRVLEKYFINDIVSLLNSFNPKLETIELHIQKSGCECIPPHQDNFYHCVEPEMGLKILLPLQELNKKRGGLIYIDCDYDFPIQDHIPSSIKNFSSYIEKSVFKNINYTETAYEYESGDASFHFLNSLHYSLGNKSLSDSLFLVFRYQDPNAKVNLTAQKNYLNCVEEHKKII